MCELIGSTLYINVSVGILMFRCNGLPNKTCPISMKLERGHKDQEHEEKAAYKDEVVSDPPNQKVVVAEIE